MNSVSQYFKGLFGGIGALLTGMSVTMKELFTKKVTQQYPENRKTLVISERFRGELVMPHDENNEHNCTACGICQMNCPNGTIKVISQTIETEDGKKKKILDQYFYDLGMCTFCNLCVITCPSDAIKFSNTFENAIFTRAKLNMKLNNEGSKLKEKKKPAPAPKPAAEKPVAEKPATATPVEKAPVEKSAENKVELTHAPDSQVDTNAAAGKPVQGEMEKQPIKGLAGKTPEEKAKADVEAAQRKAQTRNDAEPPRIIVERGNEKTQENLANEKPTPSPSVEKKPLEEDKPVTENKPQEKPVEEKPVAKEETKPAVENKADNTGEDKTKPVESDNNTSAEKPADDKDKKRYI